MFVTEIVNSKKENEMIRVGNSDFTKDGEPVNAMSEPAKEKTEGTPVKKVAKTKAVKPVKKVAGAEKVKAVKKAKAPAKAKKAPKPKTEYVTDSGGRKHSLSKFASPKEMVMSLKDAYADRVDKYCTDYDLKPFQARRVLAGTLMRKDVITAIDAAAHSIVKG